MVQQLSKEQVIQMLTSSFRMNERINSLLGSSTACHLENLFNYVYVVTEQTGRIFVNRNASNVLLYIRQSERRFTAKCFWPLVKLFIGSISKRNLIQTLRVNREIKKMRLDSARKMGDADYYYVWFLAGKEKEGGFRGLYETMDHLKALNTETTLPIYLETTVERMVEIYERGGFRVYAKKQIGNQATWFAKYDSNEE